MRILVRGANWRLYDEPSLRGRTRWGTVAVQWGDNFGFRCALER